jgi:hypothetical protein
MDIIRSGRDEDQEENISSIISALSWMEIVFPVFHFYFAV